MNRYDSPESKPLLSDPDRLICKDAALKCKKYLESLILNKIIKVVITDSTDKYGRMIGEIFINYIDSGFHNINDIMIKYGCLGYAGGTKQKYTKESLTYIINQ